MRRPIPDEIDREGGREGESIHTHTHDPTINGLRGAGYGFGFRPIVPLSSVLLLGAVVAAWFIIANNRRSR